VNNSLCGFLYGKSRRIGELVEERALYLEHDEEYDDDDDDDDSEDEEEDKFNINLKMIISVVS